MRLKISFYKCREKFRVKDNQCISQYFQIQFAGRQAPAPNDARAFLDLKLGNAALERCNKIGPKLLYP